MRTISGNVYNEMAILLINDSFVFNALHSKVEALTGLTPRFERIVSSDEALFLLNKFSDGRDDFGKILFLQLEMSSGEGVGFIDSLMKVLISRTEKISIVIFLSVSTNSEIAPIERRGIRFCINRPSTHEDLYYILFN